MGGGVLFIVLKKRSNSAHWRMAEAAQMDLFASVLELFRDPPLLSFMAWCIGGSVKGMVCQILRLLVPL